MIGNSFPEYLFIRASIAVLRLVAPTSILYLVASVYNQSFLFKPVLGVFAPALSVYAFAEASFYLFVCVPRKRRLQLPPTYTPPTLTKLERKAIFAKCCADLDIAHLHDTAHSASYPRGWFLADKTKKLRRQDVAHWLLWALFSSSPDVGREEWKEELDEYVAKVEELLGEPLSDDADESGVKAMRLTLDPVQTVHRPLVWYSIVCLVDTITSLNLLRLGFKHYSASRRWFQTFPPRPLLSFISKNADLAPDIMLPYWYRPHRSTTELPIIFLHGIGIGLHPYLPFIRDTIAQSPDIGILLVEFLPISMHMTTHPVPPAYLIASAVNNILDSLDIPRVVVVAHSYGTFITSCVLRVSHDSISTPPHAHPLLPKLAHTLLIDPIPILLHLPPVAHNFLYRAPRTAAEWQLWYFASTDPDVARTLGRAFFWTEGASWKEDVRGWMRVGTDTESNEDATADGDASAGARYSRRHIAVVLAGKDQIVPAESVRRYLTGSSEASARWVGKGWDEDTVEAGRASATISGSSLPISGVTANEISSETGYAGEDVLERSGGGDLEVLFYPELDHATVFDTRERRGPVLEVLGRFVRDI